MHDVYQLVKVDTFGNRYGVSRDESWSVAPAKSFQTIDEAEAYVMDRSLSSLVRFMPPGCDAAAFSREFCFKNDRWMGERTHFVGRPDMDAMQAALERNGVRVVRRPDAK